MTRLYKIILPVIGLLILSSFSFLNEESTVQKYKCMVQLKNYKGHGAYVVASVLDKEATYLKTLHVLGDDNDWYSGLYEWWTFYIKGKSSDIDGITGATIAGGERSIFVLEIDQSFIDNGNTLRFETAVEDQEYHATDLEVPLTSESLKGTLEGTGYIRYVRMIPTK